MRGRGLGALVSAALLLAAADSHAGSRVAILVTSAPGTSSTSVEPRLRAELTAAGFEVVRVSRQSAPDLRALEEAAVSTDSFAAIWVYEPAEGLAAEVWITDRVTGKTLLRRLQPESNSPDAPSMFALRAVELLRASLLELSEPHPARGTVAPTPALRQWVEKPIPAAPKADMQPPPRWSAMAGGAVLGGFGGMPVTIAPTIGFSWRMVSAWSAEVRLFGPALSTVSGPEATAEVDQESAVVRVVFEPGAGRGAIAPFAIAGLGIHHLGARGHATAPYRSTQGQSYSLATSLGGGALFRVNRGFGFVVEADAIAFAPRPGVAFAGRTVGLMGLPSFLGTAGVFVSW